MRMSNREYRTFQKVWKMADLTCSLRTEIVRRLFSVYDYFRLANTPARTSAALARATAIWCAYILAVVVGLAWPSSVAVVTMSTPFAIMVDAAV